MENDLNNAFEQSKILKRYYQPDFSQLFNKIKDIKTPVKKEILMGLLDGNWHSELDLIRVAKRQQKYMGAVTLGTMVNSLNKMLKNDYVEKMISEGKMYYKISDNYVGLTRAAYNKQKFVL
jgi:DNA-binding PadR family transcriptional regulator